MPKSYALNETTIILEDLCYGQPYKLSMNTTYRYHSFKIAKVIQISFYQISKIRGEPWLMFLDECFEQLVCVIPFNKPGRADNQLMNI